MESNTTASRDKVWIELTDSEKIERLRQIVKQGKNTIDELRNEIYAMRQMFHLHGHLGEDVVVPSNQCRDLGQAYDTPKGPVEIDPNYVYF